MSANQPERDLDKEFEALIARWNDPLRDPTADPQPAETTPEDSTTEEATAADSTTDEATAADSTTAEQAPAETPSPDAPTTNDSPTAADPFERERKSERVSETKSPT